MSGYGTVRTVQYVRSAVPVLGSVPAPVEAIRTIMHVRTPVYLPYYRIKSGEDLKSESKANKSACSPISSAHKKRDFLKSSAIEVQSRHLKRKKGVNIIKHY